MITRGPATAWRAHPQARRLLGAMLALLTVVFLAVDLGSTTTTAASAYGYDAPAVARVDAGPFTPAEASPTQLSGSREESASLSVDARGTSTTRSGSFIATNTVDDALGLADDAAAVVRPASTPWGRTVQDFQVNGDAWSRVSAHAEAASGRIYRGGTSIEEVFTSGDKWLVRHQIYDSTGNLVHETFRPYAKFGAG